MRTRLRVHVYDILLPHTHIGTHTSENPKLTPSKKKKSINIPFVGPFTLPSCFVRSKPPQRKKRMGGIHLGVEIGGREFAYGSLPTPPAPHSSATAVAGDPPPSPPLLQGVYLCRPKRSPGYAYKVTYNLGFVDLKLTDEEICDKASCDAAHTLCRIENIVKGVENRYHAKNLPLTEALEARFSLSLLKSLGVDITTLPKQIIKVAAATSKGCGTGSRGGMGGTGKRRRRRGKREKYPWAALGGVDCSCGGGGGDLFLSSDEEDVVVENSDPLNNRKGLTKTAEEQSQWRKSTLTPSLVSTDVRTKDTQSDCEEGGEGDCEEGGEGDWEGDLARRWGEMSI